jgi:hypothetical protein
MPPYQNESLHDMHALIQQLDALNAAHAPEHLEWPSLPTYKDVKDAANAGAKKVADTYNSAKDTVNKKMEERDQSSKKLATDQEMIDYHFSKDVPRKEDYLKLVIGSTNFPLDDLLKMMSQSSVMKTAMLNTFYPEVITNEKRGEAYTAMHPTK